MIDAIAAFAAILAIVANAAIAAIAAFLVSFCQSVPPEFLRSFLRKYWNLAGLKQDQ